MERPSSFAEKTLKKPENQIFAFKQRGKLEIDSCGLPFYCQSPFLFKLWRMYWTFEEAGVLFNSGKLLHPCSEEAETRSPGRWVKVPLEGNSSEA